jgi:hypothetical protein
LRDNQNLDEYKSQQFPVDSDHLPKINRWISRRKFNITPSENADELLLNLGDLFNYQLKKEEKTDMQKIREMMRQINDQKTEFDSKQKLFEYAFFNHPHTAQQLRPTSDYFYEWSAQGFCE